LGGDEFAVTAHVNIDHVDGLINKLNTLNERFNQAIGNSLSIHISLSIGALITNNNYTSNELYTKVDELLYHSKQNGKNQITLIKDIV
jgi:GGDEF domain-containing protein